MLNRSQVDFSKHFTTRVKNNLSHMGGSVVLLLLGVNHSNTNGEASGAIWGSVCRDKKLPILQSEEKPL